MISEIIYSIMDDFHRTGWDAFEHMVRITHLVEELKSAHNRLAESHLILQTQVLEQQKIITELCQRSVKPPQ